MTESDRTKTFETIVTIFADYIKQDIRNFTNCEALQKYLIQLLDTETNAFLKTGKRNVLAEPICLYSDGSNQDENTTDEDDHYKCLEDTNEHWKRFIRDYMNGYVRDVIVKDIEEAHPDIEISKEDCGSTMESMKKLIPLWIDCWLPDKLHNLDDKIPNWKEIIQEARQKQDDSDMKGTCQIDTALLTTFPLIKCCDGELCYTTDGDLLWLLEMDSFGNPEDKCWKLIVELGLPVFYQNSRIKDTLEAVYTRISNPADPKWYCSTGAGKLGFYPDGLNPVIANFRHIGILLTNPFDDKSECRIAYKADQRPVFNEDAIQAMIDCICDHYGRVPKDLVQAIVKYYREG